MSEPETSPEIICTLTSQEQIELKAHFEGYLGSGDITLLNNYKKQLAIKYDFEWDKVSIDGKGNVRKVF